MYNFTHTQARHICASQPSLAQMNWLSEKSCDKLHFLVHVLHMTPGEITAKPTSLTYALPNRIGPRVEFLCQCDLMHPATHLSQSSHYGKLFVYSDIRFVKSVNAASVRSGLVYDEAFKQHWLQRWHYLRQTMRLSVADIAAHPTLLLTSLQGTLCPRWCFLVHKQVEQAEFLAKDHLTTVATLSDERFTHIYSRPGLEFDKQNWRQ